jgi:outer membrane receptor for ferrienterochelin and colicin
MNRKKISLLFVSLCAMILSAFAQGNGSLSGTVMDKERMQSLVGASIILEGTQKGTSTDSSGYFRITAITPGTYTIRFTAVGYKEVILYNIVISSGNESNFAIQMEPLATSLKEVVVGSSRRTARAASLESPLSVQRLTTEEIRSNPGGNFDISRVIQALPGVGGTSGSVGGYRNDIIIRGGAPNENVYYLDGIEVPVINHFATQGSAGGPTGMLNVSFIEEVKLNTSSFEARYDNALSSVLQFKQKTGNPNKVQGNLRLSATDVAATLEGPLSKSTTFLASVRRSYLQVLFKAVDLPIRPNYWDFQYKVTHKINPKLTLTFLGIGAIDEFGFAAPREATPEKLYILDATPSIEQWNYTTGAILRKQIPNGYWNIALSRNMMDNAIEKFDNNEVGNEGKRRTGIFSQEIENKLRFDVNKLWGEYKVSYGVVAQYVKSNTNSFIRIRQEFVDDNGNLIQPAAFAKYNSNIKFWRTGAFAQVSRRLLNDKLSISTGIRTDGNSFTSSGNNPLKTLSGRLGLSYKLAENWALNASVGNYYKIAPYTILSFKDNNGTFVNKDADYTKSVHYVAGFEFLPKPTTRLTLEGFYKKYDNVPVSLRNGISLSNLGGDFAVLGNEDVITIGKGETYGVELFSQQKLTRNFFATFSYTFFVSRYSGIDKRMVASAWDNRHLVSFIGGYKLKRNWEIGLKFRYQGGAPSTPFQNELSKLNYLTLGTGLLDYAQLNSQRLDAFHTSDLRVDKRWNFKNATLNLFIEINNWYKAPNPSFPQYTFKRNETNTGFLTTDGQPIRLDGSNAIPVLLGNEEGRILPSIGFIVEY